jgi:RNA polymerase sigma factor (sigma-70 family)
LNGRKQKLVESAMRGNRDSYGALVKDYTGFVYTMALRMTGDHHMAEDLCQEIFLKGWLKLGRLEEPAAFSGWISTLARRTCLNAVEKRKRRMELGEEEAVLVNLNPTLPESYDPSRVMLEEAILQLPLQDREVITLCYFQELDSSEASEVLGIPPGTVRVYLHRARKRLYELLKGRENELLG